MTVIQRINKIAKIRAQIAATRRRHRSVADLHRQHVDLVRLQLRFEIRHPVTENHYAL